MARRSTATPDGSLALGREAAHSAARIVHVKGDRAGAEISRTLAERALATPSITVLEGFHAVELAMEDGRVTGLFARTGIGRRMRGWSCSARRAVIFATGGLGALYAVTTNPLESRGEGLGMAARAGAVIADPEFVQFHPTAIAIGRDPAPLATEALRGEGAMLVDETGVRFMPAVHKDAELAPRDVVARAIHREIAAGHKVFLDCREAIGAEFAGAFPDRLCRLQSRRHRSGARSRSRSRRPRTTTWAASPATRAAAPRCEGLWVVGECAVHRTARRQPAGLQLAAGSPGVRRARGRGRARPRSRHAPAAARRPRRSASPAPRRRMCCAMR